MIKLCFYERKLQVQESEKYEEWKNNRPADRILEIGTILYTMNCLYFKKGYTCLTVSVADLQ